MSIRTAGPLLLLALLPACSGSGEAAEVTAGRKGRIVDSSAGTVALGIRDLPYKPTAVATTGSVSGSVSLQSTSPDSVIKVARDQRVCGDSATITESSPAHALVWIDGITSGKALPEVRREQLVVERCRFSPRVLGVVAGTTINVHSRDPVARTTRFYREGAGEPIDEIWTTDAGQVVPSEKLAGKPGMVEVRVQQHPWIRAYIAVFDHPYFAVADERGSFTIDGLPPGTYTLKVWHERMDKPSEQRVVVGPGGAGRLELSLALR